MVLNNRSFDACSNSVCSQQGVFITEKYTATTGVKTAMLIYGALTCLEDLAIFKFGEQKKKKKKFPTDVMRLINKG